MSATLCWDAGAIPKKHSTLQVSHQLKWTPLTRQAELVQPLLLLMKVYTTNSSERDTWEAGVGGNLLFYFIVALHTVNTLNTSPVTRIPWTHNCLMSALQCSAKFSKFWHICVIKAEDRSSADCYTDALFLQHGPSCNQDFWPDFDQPALKLFKHNIGFHLCGIFTIIC